MWALDEGFEELEEMQEVSTDDIKAALIKHYDNEYLNKVNFKIKGAKPKKETEEYLPKSKSAQIAQYLYIVENEHKIGEKEKLVMSKKHKEEYSTTHVQVHPAYKQILDHYGLYDIFIVNAKGDLDEALVERWVYVKPEYSLNIDAGLTWAESMEDTPYKQESWSLRKSENSDGLEYIDCSELVSRYLHKIGWSKEVRPRNTQGLLNYAESHPDKLVENTGTLKKGDIFVWRKSNGGHTGIIKNYNSETNIVTTIEAISETSQSTHPGINFHEVSIYDYHY
ncbi:CHAP domain-containing protein [Sulfurimonas sp.]|uniref:CHAP domain-containing protein n=1 Tax=Sulfurimonas sp. TaxID=2022749 RepID=UPI0025E82A2D|nr:CHAP domain-containing protein [Sulfurimonas sp.]